jgi:outer membrane protein assembly factor BamA
MVIFVFSHSFSQKYGPAIERVVVYGNIRTKPAMIKRKIALKEGDLLEAVNIQKSKLTLIELGIFDHVDIEMKEGKDGVIILITVKERASLILSPIISFNDGQAENYSEVSEKSLYGIQLGLNDFSGKRRKVSLTAGLGSLKKIELTFRRDYSSRFFWSCRLANLWYESDIIHAKIQTFDSTFYLGKRINEFIAQSWIHYQHIKPGDLKGIPEKLYKVGLDLSYNSKDWNLYPRQGVVAKVTAYKALDNLKEEIYQRFSLQLSTFFNLIKDHVLALDFTSTLSKGTVPLIDTLYFGGYRTLRGIPVGDYLGDNLVVFSGEYRFPITIAHKESKREQFLGSAIYLFSDFGLIGPSSQDLKLKNLLINTGIGFIWLVAKDASIRFDVSIHPKVRFTVSSGWKF